MEGGTRPLEVGKEGRFDVEVVAAVQKWRREREGEGMRWRVCILVETRDG